MESLTPGEPDATDSALPGLEKDILATSGQNQKKTCEGDCWRMDSPLKSSKGRWLIRLRSCRSCGRKVKPITYKTDSEIENLRKDKTDYENFKRDIEAVAKNKKALW